MSERIVVSCRMNGEEVGRPEARYLERARGLAQHAEALGATLAAWSATTMAFAWDTESLDEAVAFACGANGGTEAHGKEKTEKIWACAIARGDLIPLAEKRGKGEKETGGGGADLAWGEPLVTAVILARAARPGEVLVEASFEGLEAFVATGKRSARDGERRVRGVRIDPRQPWKRDLGSEIERMTASPFVGPFEGDALLARPGVVHVLRADPGHGGTRMLTELARAVAPAPSILVSPAGASVEPLGALRRALVRALATRPYPDDPELAPVLDMFLGGIGASIEQASALVGAFLRPRTAAEPPGALLLDDAGDIDAESLEACAQLVAWMASPFHVFVRIDATDPLPAVFAALPLGREIELGLMEQGDAEAFARGLTAGALSGRSARRIARGAGYAPLAIEEEVALGLTTGEIAWVGERAALRTASSLAGKPASAERWIAKRAKATAPDERGVLAAFALLGGEAPIDSVREVLALVEPAIMVADEVKKLIKRRWLVASLPGWAALASRTHKDTIADLLDESPRRALNSAIADVLEQTEGELGCAEAANHAVKGGDGERGARLALRAARAAQSAGMAKSASRLLTLARLADPKCEPLTRQQLLTSLPPPIMPPTTPPSSRTRAPLLPAPPVPGARATNESAPRQMARATLDEPPTQRRSVPAARAPTPARDGHESDYPTLLNARAFSEPPPVPKRAAPQAIERPTEPDPVPAYVLRPPPRAAAIPRPAARGAGPPPPPLGLPRASAPLPIRGSVQAMPAVVPRPPPGPPPRAAGGAPSAPPIARPPPAVAPPPPPPPVVAVEAEAPSVAARMIDLAKSALVEGDAAGLDRWTEGLRAAGGHDRIAERIEALGRLTRGQVGEALRSLRALRDGASGSSLTTRAQTSLALGVALAAANRPDEALLEGLDALARAREGRDIRATGACLAFLAKLYARLERGEDSTALVTAAKA